MLSVVPNTDKLPPIQDSNPTIANQIIQAEDQSGKKLFLEYEQRKKQMAELFQS
jgi:hypothetical protein